MADVRILETVFQDTMIPVYNVQMQDVWGMWKSHEITTDYEKALGTAKHLMLTSSPKERIVFLNGETVDISLDGKRELSLDWEEKLC